MSNQHSKCDDCYNTHLPEGHLSEVGYVDIDVIEQVELPEQVKGKLEYHSSPITTSTPLPEREKLIELRARLSAFNDFWDEDIYSSNLPSEAVLYIDEKLADRRTGIKKQIEELEQAPLPGQGGER